MWFAWWNSLVNSTIRGMTEFDKITSALYMRCVPTNAEVNQVVAGMISTYDTSILVLTKMFHLDKKLFRKFVN